MIHHADLTEIVIILALLLIATCHSLVIDLPVSAEQYALNGLNILSEEPASSAINPTLIYPGISSSSTNLYSINGLLLHNLSLATKIKGFGVAAGCSYLEFSTYQEVVSHFSLNSKIKNFTLGIMGRYIFNRVDNYHRSKQILCDAAILWTTHSTKSTFLYKNVLNQRMLDLKLPVCIVWESRLTLSESIKLGLGLEKEQDEKFSFKLGSRYEVQKFLTLLISCQYEPVRIGAGIEFKLHHLKLSYSILTHQYLPYTHSINITYEMLSN